MDSDPDVGTGGSSHVRIAENQEDGTVIPSLQKASMLINARKAETRFDGTELLRNVVIEIRDAICERLEIETDELVLASLLQTLQMLCVDSGTVTKIMHLAREDRRTLIRAYAISALPCSDTSSVVGFLIGRLATEARKEVRIQILLALYRLGHKDVFPEIIRLMRTANYHTQCAAIDGILGVDLGSRKAEVIEVLRNLATADVPVAVSSAARAALKEL